MDVLTALELERKLDVEDGTGVAFAWDVTSATNVLILNCAGAAVVGEGTSAADVLVWYVMGVFTGSEIELENSTAAELLAESELEVADCTDDVEEVTVCCVHAHEGLLSAQYVEQTSNSRMA